MRFMLLCIICISCVCAQESYKFGVFPHLPLKKLHTMYSPVSDDLQRYTDKPVTLMSKPYYKLYKQELDSGLYDIAFVQPFDYIQAREKQGYIPLVRRAKNLEAIIVVNANADFQNIDDIKNGIIASAPSTAAVTRMMLRELEMKGYQVLDDFTISYSKNHFICMQKVLNGKALACITAKRTLNMFLKDKNKDTFRILYTTQSLPHVLFIAHPRVSKDVRETLTTHLLEWNEDSDLKLAKEKFIEASDKDYDAVRDFLKKEE